jgi:epoxyqueuosine reductase
LIRKVVLHICCAVCAAGAVERLILEGWQVVGYFYNPNIYPAEEYHRRLEAAQKAASELKFPLIEGLYKPEEWFQATAGLENEPEGGRRCPVCFKMRLDKTYRYMIDSGADCFTTTLTMGSNKSAALMERLGREVGGDKFLLRDFKKKDGFKRAGELSRQWEIYRQHYCGCQYSLREKV